MSPATRMVRILDKSGRIHHAADRYGLPLSSASAVARDAYVQGSDLLLTLYPGAIEAFDRAIAADPGFALAHAGKAQVLMREGNVVAARACLEGAKAVAADLPAREASHIAFLDLVFAGRTEPAIARVAYAPCKMAARRPGAQHRGEPERPHRRLRPHRAEAPDRHPVWTASPRTTATISGFWPIMPWRCRRTASTRLPA